MGKLKSRLCICGLNMVFAGPKYCRKYATSTDTY